MILLLIAVITASVGMMFAWGLFDVGLSCRQRAPIKFMCVAIIFSILIFPSFWVPLGDPPPPPPPPEYAPAYLVDWEVIPSSDTDYIIQTGNRDFLWEVSCDANGSVANTTATFTYYICRTDTQPGKAFGTIELDSVGELTSDNMTYQIIARRTDGFFMFDWSNAGNATFNEDIVVPTSDNLRAETVWLNVTISGAAVQRMADYETLAIWIDALGYYSTIAVVRLPQEAEP